MSNLRVTHETSASPQACWDLIADFKNIAVFNPNLSRSYLLEGSSETGVGTTRQCDLKDGKNFIRERVLEWNEGSDYTVEIYEGSMPVDKAIIKIGITPLPLAGGGTQVFMDFAYAPRMGPLGKVLDVVMMRAMFKKMLQRVIE
ncbi:MAG: SRPBCC family protein, partial [Alphaproteobacteria bacterium]|nr:SRPBCC family protein [Alphaproteobacteria bacterium]